MLKRCAPLWREAHFEVESVKNWRVRSIFWTFRCRFAWQAQGIVHHVKSEQNVKVLYGRRGKILRGSAKIHFPWQAQYKRHVHQEVRALISWEGLHFGASDLQVCWDDFAWQVQHFVWHGLAFLWQAQYFRQVEWKNRKTHCCEAVSSVLNFPFLKGSLELLRFWCCQLLKMRKSHRCFSFLTLSNSKIKEVSQNCCVFWCCQVQKLRKSRRIAPFSILQIDR